MFLSILGKKHFGKSKSINKNTKDKDTVKSPIREGQSFQGGDWRYYDWSAVTIHEVDLNRWMLKMLYFITNIQNFNLKYSIFKATENDKISMDLSLSSPPPN
jgi:outer membrane receptor for Fe3+-dicitrate